MLRLVQWVGPEAACWAWRNPGLAGGAGQQGIALMHLDGGLMMVRPRP